MEQKAPLKIAVLFKRWLRLNLAPYTVYTPLNYGLYGDLIRIYPTPYSIYVQGTTGCRAVLAHFFVNSGPDPCGYPGGPQD